MLRVISVFLVYDDLLDEMPTYSVKAHIFDEFYLFGKISTYSVKPHVFDKCTLIQKNTHLLVKPTHLINIHLFSKIAAYLAKAHAFDIYSARCALTTRKAHLHSEITAYSVNAPY